MTVHWTPGIGDPSLMGWATVVLYGGAALLCWSASGAADPSGGSILERGLWGRRERGRDRRFWRCLALVFAVLAINKQLDLQSLLTELARIEALGHGWYDDRRFWQVAFIAGLTLCGLAAALAGAIVLRRRPAPVRLALAGLLFTLCFVVARAASFHHVDRFLAARIGGWHMNWLLEWAGILTVAGAAACYERGAMFPNGFLRLRREGRGNDGTFAIPKATGRRRRSS